MDGRVWAFMALWVIMAVISMAAIMSGNSAIQKVGYIVALFIMFACILLIDG